MITGADFEEEEKKPGGFLKGERQVPTQRTGCKKGVDGEVYSDRAAPQGSLWGAVSLMKIVLSSVMDGSMGSVI